MTEERTIYIAATIDRNRYGHVKGKASRVTPGAYVMAIEGTEPDSLLVGCGYVTDPLPLYVHAVSRLIDDLLSDLPGDDLDPDNSFKLRVCTPFVSLRSRMDEYLMQQKRRNGTKGSGDPVENWEKLNRVLALQSLGKVSYVPPATTMEEVRLSALKKIATSQCRAISDVTDAAAMEVRSTSLQ